jgi:CheY-like chemotaxis protein
VTAHTIATSPASAATLLAEARARFQDSLGRTVVVLETGAVCLDDAPTDEAAIETIRAEAWRVVAWAEAFELTGLALVAGGLLARAERWADGASAQAGARARVVRESARLLLTLAAPRTEDRVDATSERGVGGPAVSEALTALPSALPSPLPDDGATAAGATDDAPDVVIVEDEAGMAGLLSFGLEQIGLRSATFDNGAAALDALRRMPARGGRPVVLLDVELPGLDGHAVHEQLEADRPGAFTFVFTSGRISEGEQVRAITCGAADYVTKPVSLRVLMAKVQRWVAAGAPPPPSASGARRAA